MTIFKNVFQRHLEENDAALAIGDAPEDVRPLINPVDLPQELSWDTPVLPRSEQHPIPAPSKDSPEAPLLDRGEPPAPAFPEDDETDLAMQAAQAQRLIEETQAMRHTPADAPVVDQGVAPDPSIPQETPNRARTRLLGFGDAASSLTDPLTGLTDSPGQAKFPCGWLVITEGPGRGAGFALHPGVAQIGRGSDQAISLDFGDRAISRAQHAVIAYDPKVGKFYLGHGGKSNIIRLNDRPVLSTEEIAHGDLISIGETMLRFAAFCDQSFAWDEEDS